MKKLLTLVVIVVLALGVYFYFRAKPAGETGTQAPTPSQESKNPQAKNSTSPTPDQVYVTITVKNFGSFKLELDAKAAPKTVANFVKLANEKYCDGTKFHRIVRTFVIQGCDPNSRGSDPTTYGLGGPGYTISSELGLKANVGAIGMASTAAKGPSNGSQFFIVTTESADSHAALDGNYTIFGYVTSGMDVVTKIASVPTEPNPVTGEASSPLTPVVIQSITIDNP